MKILQVNNVYKVGSTGKIVDDLHNAFITKGHSSIVCYGRGKKITLPNVYKFCGEESAKFRALLSRFGCLQYGGNIISTKRLISTIETETPDIVHLQCINDFCVNIYKLLEYLAVHEINTVITHHAEFFYTGSCGHAYECLKWTAPTGCKHCNNLQEATYSRLFDSTSLAWKRMNEAFRKFNPNKLIFTAVSPWVKDRSLLAETFRKYRCEVVLNGVELSFFNRKKDISNELLDKVHGFKDVILYVTSRYNPENKNDIKGAWYLTDLAKKRPKSLFIIVANEFSSQIPLPSNIYFHGRTKDRHELAMLYSLSHITVLLSKRETFSMICAESLCCGTPVVGFFAGGPESISIPEYSRFVEYGNLSALNEAIEDILSSSFNGDCIAEKAQSLYSKEKMAQSYINVYNMFD